MEWLRKILNDNSVQNVDNIVNSAEGELSAYYVPKANFNEQAENVKKLNTDLQQRDKDLEMLKKSSGDNEALKKQFNDLQAKYDAETKKHVEEMKEQRLNNAIRLHLVGKTHDESLVMGFLDKSKIELNEDGTIKLGFKEQLESLQKDKYFLFKSEQNNQFRGITPHDSNADNQDAPDVDSSISIAKQAAQSAVSKDVSSANDYYFKRA